MFLLFLILSLLFCIEASTSISRKSGYTINNPASGLILQNSLGLLSRALIFMFMPMIGAFSDSGDMFTSASDLIVYYLMLPASFVVLFLFRREVEIFFLKLLNRVEENGSYFIKNKKEYSAPEINVKLKTLTKFRNLYILTFFAYIPYYLAWPLIIILLDNFNNNRGLILGLSSVFNGINTLILTVFVDPKLAQIGAFNRVIKSVYNEMLVVRLCSALAAVILFSFLCFFLEIGI